MGKPSVNFDSLYSKVAIVLLISLCGLCFYYWPVEIENIEIKIVQFVVSLTSLFFIYLDVRDIHKRHFSVGIATKLVNEALDTIVKIDNWLFGNYPRNDTSLASSSFSSSSCIASLSFVGKKLYFDDGSEIRKTLNKIQEKVDELESKITEQSQRVASCEVKLREYLSKLESHSQQIETAISRLHELEVKPLKHFGIWFPAMVLASVIDLAA